MDICWVCVISVLPQRNMCALISLVVRVASIASVICYSAHRRASVGSVIAVMGRPRRPMAFAFAGWWVRMKYHVCSICLWRHIAAQIKGVLRSCSHNPLMVSCLLGRVSCTCDYSQKKTPRSAWIWIAIQFTQLHRWIYTTCAAGRRPQRLSERHSLNGNWCHEASVTFTGNEIIYAFA